MSVPYYGDFPEDAPVYIPFNTFSSDDPSASVTISDLADTDIYYHKDGSTTDYSADAATLVTIDFDGITGNHMLAIATTENAYFATGSEYAVRMEGTTVDGATINAFIGAFSIERAGGALATAKLILADTDDIGVAGAGLTDLGGMSSGMKAEVEAECTDAIEADGLDHLLAASVAGTDITDNSIIAKLVDDAATADWDNYDPETASLEALNVDTDAIKAETALIVADTDVIDDGTSGLVKIAQDVAAALADTNELQTDNYPTSIAAVKTDTAAIATAVVGAISELTGIAGAPATPTLKQALILIYMWLRNNTQVTSSERRILNDAGTEVLDATASDDGTTFAQGKLTDA